MSGRGGCLEDCCASLNDAACEIPQQRCLRPDASRMSFTMQQGRLPALSAHTAAMPSSYPNH